MSQDGGKELAPTAPSVGQAQGGSSSQEKQGRVQEGHPGVTGAGFKSHFHCLLAWQGAYVAGLRSLLCSQLKGTLFLRAVVALRRESPQQGLAQRKLPPSRPVSRQQEFHEHRVSEA